MKQLCRAVHVPLTNRHMGQHGGARTLGKEVHVVRMSKGRDGLRSQYFVATALVQCLCKGRGKRTSLAGVDTAPPGPNTAVQTGSVNAPAPTHNQGPPTLQESADMLNNDRTCNFDPRYYKFVGLKLQLLEGASNDHDMLEHADR